MHAPPATKPWSKDDRVPQKKNHFFLCAASARAVAAAEESMSNDDDEDWDDDLEDTTDVNAAVREERRQFTVREEIGEVIRDFKGYGWRLGAAALQLARWSGRIAWVGYTVMLFANLPLFMKVRPLSLLCAGGVPPLPARRLQKSASCTGTTEEEDSTSCASDTASMPASCSA
tara:strand:+ start:1474 stop:1992 length:519 start_codon:yes stop_codon:yes gene_type:complete